MLIPFKELFARHGIQSTGVLHLGANTGQEAAEYSAHGMFPVIWVEALPDVYTRLVDHVAQYPGSKALLGCLSDKDEDIVTFNVTNNEAQSSSFLQFGTHAHEHPTVKVIHRVKMLTTRLDTLLTRHKIEVGVGWFLNVDLQGAELLALKGMGNLLGRFDHAYIEVNEKHLYQGCPLVGEIDRYLAMFGFAGVEVKMTGSGWGDKYYRRQT